MKKNSAKLVKATVFMLFVAAVCAVAYHRSQSVGGDREGLGENFDLDLEKYMDVDPALITYDEQASISVDLQKVMALAVGPDDRLYVAGDKSVKIMTAAGKVESTIELPSAPNCVTVSAEGLIYIGIGNHVEVYGANGKQQASWQPTAADAIISTIVVEGEDVYVSEAKIGQVQRYNLDGEIVSAVKGFVLFSSFNLGIAVDPRGRLWAANPGGRELRRYADDGSIAASWKKPGRDINGFSGCCNPTDIAFRADGAIVTSEKHIVRVKVVDQTGKLLGVVAGPRSFDQKIEHLDVAVDSKGRVLVLDPKKKAIRVFTEKK